MSDPYAFKRGVLLAETLEKVKPAPPDPTGWFISEKLDGVRAYWNGTNFYSRNGLLFDAPEWFKAGLPKDTHLDGELWCGREQFERCVGIIKYHKGSTADEWKHLLFLCFDAPIVAGSDSLPYEARHEALKAAVTRSKYAAAVGIRKCTGQADLDDKLKAVLAHGGEGLMLRRPGSLYERCRSKSLLKVKTFLDAEAKVVGYSEGKGKHQGCLGALQLEMPLSGFRFEVGTGFTDAQRNWLGAKKRYPMGSVITYKYQNLTLKGVPRFPVFLRERTDKSWDDVVADAQKDVDDQAAKPPSLAKQPSLMMHQATEPGASAKAPAAAAATAAAATASGSSAAPPPLKRAASSFLFTDDSKVDAAASSAEAHAGPPSKKPKSEKAVDAAVEAEPKLLRSDSKGGADGEAAAAAPAAAKAKAKKKSSSLMELLGSEYLNNRGPWDSRDFWETPAGPAALAAEMRDLVKSKKFDRLRLWVGGTMCALREPQIKALSRWAELRKFDREYLHVTKDGVPHHFEAMDGAWMTIFVK